MIQRCAAILAVLVCLTTPARAVPIWIQEVVYDVPGPDSADAFTELGGEPGTSLDGWFLVGVTSAGWSPVELLPILRFLPLVVVLSFHRSSPMSYS